MKVVHTTTVDLSLRFLAFPQLKAVVKSGGEAVGISGPGRGSPSRSLPGSGTSPCHPPRGEELRTGMALRGRERALERFDERDVVAKVPNPHRGVARRLTQ